MIHFIKYIKFRATAHQVEEIKFDDLEEMFVNIPPQKGGATPGGGPVDDVILIYYF